MVAIVNDNLFSHSRILPAPYISHRLFMQIGAVRMANLNGVWLKLERAEHHVRNLEQTTRAFRESKPYSIGAKPHKEPRMKHTTLFVERLDPIPDDIPLIVGDAVHNLRSALDHLAWQLVLANGEKPTRDTYFPIQDPGKVDTAPFALGKVRGMCEGAKELICKIQPGNTNDATLWNLHTLDIADKHHLVLAAQFGSHNWSVNALGSGDELQFDKPIFPLVEGQEITNLPTATYSQQKNDDFQLSIDIAFGESEVMAGEPILASLDCMVKLGRSLIGQFERFFT
jgi:hypothetical protein